MSGHVRVRGLVAALGVAVASAFLRPPVSSTALGRRAGAVGGGLDVAASCPVAPRGRACGAASMGLADALPRRFKGVLGKRSKPAPKRTRTEGAELYRTLGVSPDADYMDVVAACDRLKEKYKGDRKKAIQFDKAKDDIMSLRLKQAVSGTLKSTEEAQSVNRYLAARDEWRRKQNSPFRVPKWAKGWIKPPDKEHFQACAFRHAIMAAFALAFPSAVTGLQVVGGMCCFGATSNRDAPDLKRDENNQIAEIRLPAKKTILLSFSTCFLSFTTGSFVGIALCKYFGERYIVRESWEGFFIQVAFFLSSLYISTWRDPDTGPKVSKKRGLGGRGPE